jgi:predicted nucleotidyltransferase
MEIKTKGVSSFAGDGLGFISMYKKAGILDKIRNQLATDVWNERMVLRPELRKNIIETIEKVTPLSNVEGAWIIGSITGYQYTETSDVDVNVSVFNFSQDLREKAKKLSGVMTHSGRHPVNLFLKETSGTFPTWQDSFFGVYDVINNDWVNLPPSRDIFRDPDAEFKLEILYARKIAQDFNERVDRLKNLIRSIHRYKRMEWSLPALARPELVKRRAVIKDQLTKLVDMVHALEDDRKFVYQWGWGIPRKDFRNIVYKVLEHGRYGNLFLILEKIPLSEEFGSDDMLRKEASRADSLLSRAVKHFSQGKSDVIPSFGEYRELKSQEYAESIRKPSRTATAVGLGVGGVLGLLATKKKAPWRTALRNVSSGVVLGATLGHGIASRAKVIAARRMIDSNKDLETYNNILQNQLTS